LIAFNARRLCGLALTLLCASQFAHAGPIYVSDIGDATVKVFDQYSGAYMGTWGAGFLSYPAGLAVDTQNNLFVADFASGQVFRFNASDGQYEGQFGSGFLSGPRGLAVDSNDVVYVANAGGDDVVRFNGLTGNYMGAIATGYAQLPAGVAMGPSNELFLSDYGGGKVFRFDSQTGLYEGYVGGGFAPNPIGVAVDPYGVLDVYDSAGNQALKFNSQSGGYMGLFGQGYARTGFGMAIDQNSVVYLADETGGAVDLFNNDTGAYMGQIGAGTLINPLFVAILPEPTVVLPISYSLFRGVLFSGTLSSLFYTDGNFLEVLTGPTLNNTEAPVQVIVTGTSPTLTPASLTFTVTGKVDTPGIDQVISLFNYSTNAYVVLDTRAAKTTNQTVTVTATGTLSQYVSASGAVRARIAYLQVGPTLIYRWAASIDLTNWGIQVLY